MSAAGFEAWTKVSIVSPGFDICCFSSPESTHFNENHCRKTETFFFCCKMQFLGLCKGVNIRRELSRRVQMVIFFVSRFSITGWFYNDNDFSA